ncbi:hypothetical protein BO71DRAFT_238411 [Aspergillus ellipticus CBS 707.79]|uniref:Uncharacterized protein n=1 Tax=Aspergillus ellipticus CBS 707.79 TaxID=1448320 RepID=A0A319D9U2_9EURO|nr:hypothetical protein BO71DRAFT_238411 [Aspergillus ellipticus CBS 707.79]
MGCSTCHSRLDCPGVRGTWVDCGVYVSYVGGVGFESGLGRGSLGMEGWMDGWGRTGWLLRRSVRFRVNMPGVFQVIYCVIRVDSNPFQLHEMVVMRVGGQTSSCPIRTRIDWCCEFLLGGGTDLLQSRNSVYAWLCSWLHFEHEVCEWAPLKRLQRRAHPMPV